MHPDRYLPGSREHDTFRDAATLVHGQARRFSKMEQRTQRGRMTMDHVKFDEPLQGEWIEIGSERSYKPVHKPASTKT